ALVDHRGILLDRLLDVGDRRQRLVADLDPLGGVLCGRAAQGHDQGHRLAHVMDLVGGDRILLGISLLRDEGDGYRQRGLELLAQLLAEGAVAGDLRSASSPITLAAAWIALTMLW